VANNHTDDAGAIGLQETDEALTAAHLSWTGRPGQITYLVRNGIKVALLGFAPYDYDSNLLDIPAAVAAVKQATQHAQLVIVFIHAGAEGAGAQHVRPGMETYLGEERGDPIAFAHAVVDAGADLVLGSAASSSPTASATSPAITPSAWAASPRTARSCTSRCAPTARSPGAA
jgi:poly-gamma-glutamate capsule biosynthesis protein CapA/YwtB (metallophosphatase superfamily)